MALFYKKEFSSASELVCEKVTQTLSVAKLVCFPIYLVGEPLQWQ